MVVNKAWVLGCGHKVLFGKYISKNVYQGP